MGSAIKLDQFTELLVIMASLGPLQFTPPEHSSFFLGQLRLSIPASWNTYHINYAASLHGCLLSPVCHITVYFDAPSHGL